MKKLLVASLCICLLPVSALSAEKASPEVVSPPSKEAKASGNDLTDYFPMVPGSVWRYESPKMIEMMQSSFKSLTPVWIETVESCSDDVLGASGCILTQKTVLQSPPVKLVYSLRNKSIVLRASKSPYESNWKVKPTAEIQLKEPIAKNTTWENSESNTEKTRYKIIGKQRLQVQAGEFENVLKIEKNILVKSSSKKSTKWVPKNNGETDETLYYAPGVGLIKVVITKTGETFRELIEFKPGNASQ